MTNEEAIHYLEWLSDIDFTKEYPKYPIVTKQEQVEALQMAVEALKAKDLDEQLWLLNEFSTCDLRERTIELVLNANFDKKMALLDKTVEPKMDGTDTISRQAAINIVVFECGEWTGLAKEISKQLRQLPPAQPERKKGHKINQNQYPAKWVCSECGARHFDFSDNFCSQCGADLRGEEK